MSMNFAFFMDISILVLLAATVFLAVKLTFSLRNFNESRSEMEGLVNRLNANIDKAENAIGGMQGAARKVGLELDEIISDAKKLSGELKIMNESGNSLANRLEKIAEKNRAMVDKIESAGAAPIHYNRTVAPRNVDAELENELARSFVIQDRALDEEFDDDYGAAHPSGLQSRAEQELFEALQGNKGRQTGGRK